MRAGALLLACLMVLGVFTESAMAVPSLAPMEIDELMMDSAEAYDPGEALPEGYALSILPADLPVDVIEIGTPAELRTFLNGGLGPNDAHFVLTANINVITGSTAFVTQGRGFSPYCGTSVFTGTFDGRDHTITNLRLRRVTGDDIDGNTLFNTSAGFIRNAGDGARIENLRFATAGTTADTRALTANSANLRAGMAVGRVVSGAVTIQNVHLTGHVFMEATSNQASTRIGGMVGHVEARAGITLRDISISDFEVLASTGSIHSIGGVVASSSGTVTVTATNPGNGTVNIIPPAANTAPNGRNSVAFMVRGGGRYHRDNNAGRVGGVIAYAANGSHTTIEHTNVSHSPRVASTHLDASVRAVVAGGGMVGTTGTSGSLTIRHARNHHLAIIVIRAHARGGGIVGRTGVPTTIDNVINNARVYSPSSDSGQTGDNVILNFFTGITMGGIIGRTDGITSITNVVNNGAVESGLATGTGVAAANGRNHTSFLGGIVGFANNRITIQDATNTATIRRSRSSARANNHVGGIIGHIHNGGSVANRRAELRNVTNAGTINTQTGDAVTHNAGGIVGFVRDRASAVVIIADAINTGNVRARNNAGGIIGHANSRNILITGAMNYGNISTAMTGARRAGGIVGLGNRTQLRIFDSGNAGTITSASSGSAGAAGFGGLVGSSSGANFRIERSFNTGFVNGVHFNTGGLVGRNTGSSVLLNVYNIGAVRSTATNGGAGILGRRALGAVRIENAFVSTNMTAGDGNGAGLGSAVAVSGTGNARPIAGLTFRNVYVDGSTFNAATTSARLQGARNGINIVTTELLTAGILPGITGGPWLTGLVNPDTGELVDPDYRRTYPYFAWQTGGDGSLQADFFTAIHIANVPAMDNQGAGNRTVSFADTNPALTRQIFNPYLAIATATHPAVTATSAAARGTGTQHISMGLISTDHVVGFSTGIVPERIEVLAYDRELFDATGERVMISWAEFASEIPGTQLTFSGLFLIELLHAEAGVTEITATATGYDGNTITLSEQDITSRRVYIPLDRVPISVVVFVRSPQTEAQVDAEQLGTIIADNSWVRYPYEGAYVNRNAIGTSETDAFFLLPNALVREEGQASAPGFSLEAFEVNPLDFRRNSDGSYVMIDGNFVLDLHLEDIRLPAFDIVPFEYGTTANANGEFPVNPINIGPLTGILRTLSIADPAQAHGLNITYARTTATTPQRFSVTSATAETEFQVFCSAGEFAPSDVFMVSPEDLEADTDTNPLFVANRVFAEMRRLQTAHVRVVEEVRIYDGAGNFVTAFENPVNTATVLVDDTGAPRVSPRPESDPPPGEFTVRAIEGNVITATAPGFVCADSGALVAEHLIQEDDLVAGNEVLIFMQRVIQAGHIHGHVLAIEAYEDEDLEFDATWGQPLADVRVVIRAGGPTGPIVYTTYTDENGFYMTETPLPLGTFYVSAVIPNSGLQAVQSHHNTVTLLESDEAGTRADVLKIFRPIETFDVSFDWNFTGAPTAVTIPNVVIDTYADTIAPEKVDVPERNGYRFIGWADEADCTIALDLEAYHLTETRSFYAVWEAYFTVTFQATPAEGGSLSGDTSQTVIDGQTVQSVPAAAANTSWTTDHRWTSSDESHTGGPFTAEEVLALPITGATTFTLTFTLVETPETWTVTFLYNDGTSAVYDTIGNVSYNTAVAQPANPTRSGHTFVTWTTDPAGHDAWNFADGVTENLRLYAQWTAVTFPVTFHWGTWTGVPADDVIQNVAWGTSAGTIEPSVIPNRLGYTFGGWNPDTENYALTEERTFVAVWNALHTLTLTYDLNGGNGGPSPLIVELQAGIHPLDLTISGRPVHDPVDGRDVAFLGWSLEQVAILEPDESRPTLEVEVTIHDESVTVFAVWTFANPAILQHTVTFYLNYGQDPMTVHAVQEVSDNSTASRPPDPERTGYTFIGWFLDQEGTHAFSFTTLIREPMSLFAQWNENEVVEPSEYWTVTFVLSGGLRIGGGELEQIVPHGQDAVPPILAPPAGYTFGGWIGSASNVTEDRTLTPHWLPITFPIMFHWGIWTGAPTNVTIPGVVHGTLAHTIEPNAASIPTRNGFEFIGWSPATQNYVLTESRVFVAQWRQLGGSGDPGNPGGPTDPSDPTHPELPWFTDEHHQYLIGLEDGTIRPNAQITRAEVATIFFRLLRDDVRAQNWAPRSNSFGDVNPEQWHHNAITTLSNLGVIHGRSANEFDPNATITRAEFIAIAARFVPQEVSASAAGSTIAMFDDAVGHWAEDYIRIMQYFGWIQGDPSGNVNPNDPITRAEVAAAVNRMLGRIHERPDTAILMVNCISTYRMDNADGRALTIWSDNNRYVGSWFYLYIQEATHSTYFEWTECGNYVIWIYILPPINWTVSQHPNAGPNDHRNR